MNEPCAVCGNPVTVVSVTEAPHKIYHGSCYRTLHPSTDDLPGVVTLYSHDDQVRDGIEQP